MADSETKEVKNIKNNVKVINSGKGGSWGGLYLVTYIGAAVYFVQQTSGFWNVVWALLKAIVWPGFVVHRALELLNI